ncbi:GlcNAc-transferase family protein [Roseovarius sp. S1116L3]|uniref:GlcNAc-transferase family protein n=1 Tax=Roseovarius roseus TaxID=3342636 RepID=UPI0037299C42
MSALIFVQIPAYRDPELLPTLRGLIETADSPELLRIVVVWQYGIDELSVEKHLRAFPQVELVKVPARYSSGCNWARSQSQRRWNGEPYTLFLDSHHQFQDGWDTTLVAWHEELRQLGVPRPILTGYMPPYGSGRDREDTILDMNIHERFEGLIYRLVGHPVADTRQLSEPFPGRFASLHFLFADGRFNEDVPFDPDIYFFSDEAAISLRAYTHGYDLFQPHRIVGWHLYDRTTRGTHWNDHSDWPKQHQRSMIRLRDLYRGELRGDLGIGSQRSVADYEAYIGAPLITS